MFNNLNKMSSFRLFPDNSEKTLLLGSVFVEVGNFALEACNVREKGTHLRRLQGN